MKDSNREWTRTNLDFEDELESTRKMARRFAAAPGASSVDKDGREVHVEEERNGLPANAVKKKG